MSHGQTGSIVSLLKENENIFSIIDKLWIIFLVYVEWESYDQNAFKRENLYKKQPLKSFFEEL